MAGTSFDWSVRQPRMLLKVTLGVGLGVGVALRVGVGVTLPGEDATGDAGLDALGTGAAAIAAVLLTTALGMTTGLGMPTGTVDLAAAWLGALDGALDGE